MSAIKKYLRKIPLFPLSTLIFFVVTMILWSCGVIPAPPEIVSALESLYQRQEVATLVLATALESLVYVCLYVPGAFVIALAVFFSDGSFSSLLMISVIVAFTMTITAIINYILGRIITQKTIRKDLIKTTKMGKRGLLAAILHPNFLAFYFFHAGLEHKHVRDILYVPILMIPYGLLVAYLLSIFSTPARKGLEDPYFLLFIVVIWFIFSWVKELKDTK